MSIRNLALTARVPVSLEQEHVTTTDLGNTAALGEIGSIGKMRELGDVVRIPNAVAAGKEPKEEPGLVNEGLGPLEVIFGIGKVLGGGSATKEAIEWGVGKVLDWIVDHSFERTKDLPPEPGPPVDGGVPGGVPLEGDGQTESSTNENDGGTTAPQPTGDSSETTDASEVEEEDDGDDDDDGDELPNPDGDGTGGPKSQPWDRTELVSRPTDDGGGPIGPASTLGSLALLRGTAIRG